MLGSEPVVDGDDLGLRPPTDLRGQASGEECVRDHVHAAVEVQNNVARFDSVDRDLGGRDAAQLRLRSRSRRRAAAAPMSPARSSSRCSSTLLSTGKADCRRIASRVSRCSVLTEDLPSVGLVWQRSRLARPCQSAAEVSCQEAGDGQPRRQTGEGRHRITVIRASRSGRPVLGERGELELVCRGALVLIVEEEVGIGDPAHRCPEAHSRLGPPDFCVGGWDRRSVFPPGR